MSNISDTKKIIDEFAIEFPNHEFIAVGFNKDRTGYSIMIRVKDRKTYDRLPETYKGYEVDKSLIKKMDIRLEDEDMG